MNIPSAGKLQCGSRNGALVIFLTMALFGDVASLQLSMVASRVPFGGFEPQTAPVPLQRQRQSKLPFAPNTFGAGAGAGAIVSSGLISQLAVVALKMRLKQFSDVSCDATASPSDLLHGRVGPVSVRGKGWGSNLGLTCRAIDATVDTCELDVGRILSQRKLRLIRPAEGRAMIAFDATDFGNFITHPLMRPPSLPGSDSNIGVNGDDTQQPQLRFLKDGVKIDSTTGAVTFFGDYRNARWKFALQRVTDNSNGGNALITAGRSDVASTEVDYDFTAAQLTTVVSRFFNEMVFELDGTFLSFKDMMVTNKSKKPTVMLLLNILVRKFPSPGLAF